MMNVSDELVSICNEAVVTCVADVAGVLEHAAGLRIVQSRCYVHT
jgi:hypothetical protein